MSRDRHPWHDAGWPVLAGLVAATGVIAAYQYFGLLAVLAAFALVELTVAPTAWSLITELGKSARLAVLEIAPACALMVVVLMGLTAAIDGWALVVLAILGLSSPLVSRQGRVRFRQRYGSDRAETRRAFDDIVANSWSRPTPKDDSGR